MLPLTLRMEAIAQTSWGITKTLEIGGVGSWDYVTVDAATHRLFVPRSTHTMVIDAESGKTLGDIAGQKNAHGVALVPELGRGFISDGGGAGAIIVFDLKTYAVLGKLMAQPDADGILYDPALKRVLVVSGDKGVLMTFAPDIDPVHGTIDAPIELGGAPEFLASDGAGKIFVNLMDKDVVAVVDLKGRKVVARWPVASGGAPVGMALDRKAKRLVIGCRKPAKMVVMSSVDGKVLAALPIGAGVDAIELDGEELLASSGDGTLAVARAAKGGEFAIAQVVKTATGARTMGLDPSTNTLYLPTAVYEVPKPGTTGRPTVKPGSFMILVVRRTAEK